MHKRFGTVKAIVLPLVVWWGTMFVVTTIPSHSVPRVALFSYDKIIHGVMYFGLTILLFRLFYLVRGVARPYSLGVTLLLVSLYGVFDEWHQPLVGRSASLYDLYADLAGMVCALVLLVVVMVLRRQQREAITKV